MSDTNETRKKRGRPPTGRPQKIRVPFNVTPDDFAWLLTLPNRSEWLRGKIEQDRDTKRSDKRAADPPDAQDDAPGSATPF